MASSHNNSSSSVFRGLHYNPSSSSGGGSGGLHFVNQFLHNHLQQHHSPSQGYSSIAAQGSSNNSGSASSGNQIISTTSTAVSLPAPAPVPGKSSANAKASESSKPSTSRSATGNNPDQMQSLVAKLWFDHNLESSLSSLEKDEHDKRMKDLRKQLEYISDTNWKYMPIEKYIGQI